LTPALFWKHKEQLLRAVEEDMPELIQHCITKDNVATDPPDEAVRVIPTNLYVGALSAFIRTELYDGIVICNDTSLTRPGPYMETRKRMKMLHLQCSDGKLGSRALREHLSRLAPFVKSLVVEGESPSILFACPTGKDFSIGVALATLCMFFDDSCKSSPISLFEGVSSDLFSNLPAIDQFNSEFSLQKVDKALVRRRLACITTQKPSANPSRSTLQSVNVFLMPRNDR